MTDLNKISYKELKQYFLDLEAMSNTELPFDTLTATRIFWYRQRTSRNNG